MLKTILFAFLALSKVALSQEENVGETNVYVLTENNFDEIVRSADIALVKFYAPWCGHCQHLAPHFIAAANELKDKVVFGEVDCTVENKLAEEFHIEGYPTLKIFRKGEAEPTDYNGPREADGIVRYMNKQSEPVVFYISDEDTYKGLTIDSEISIVMFTSDLAGDKFKQFERYSSELHELISFGVVSDAGLMASFGYSEGNIVAFRNFEGESNNKIIVFDENVYGDFKRWAEVISIPSAALITQDNYEKYQKVGLPRFTVFAKNLREESNPSGIRYVVNRLRKASANYFGKMTFVAMDSDMSQEFSDCHFTDMQPDAKYYMGIYEGAVKYCFNEPEKALKALKVADIEAFAKDFTEGKLTPYFKSQPLPEPAEENGVKIIVGSTLQEEVIDSDKDVFVAIYAPWCGHCKHLLPIWEELAQKNKENSDKLVIAKIDGTENDLPAGFEITGFPTIFWVKAGKGSEPIAYEGARSIEAFEEFIAQHSSFGATGGDEEVPKDEL